MSEKKLLIFLLLFSPNGFATYSIFESEIKPMKRKRLCMLKIRESFALSTWQPLSISIFRLTDLLNIVSLSKRREYRLKIWPYFLRRVFRQIFKQNLKYITQFFLNSSCQKVILHYIREDRVFQPTIQSVESRNNKSCSHPACNYKARYVSAKEVENLSILISHKLCN